MSLVLRLWDFDMDSRVLGPIRCARLNAEKKFAEFEEAIRSGAIDSIELARNVFRAVAHRRTGDSSIDAKCGGAVFTEEEVSTVPKDELDLFCDKLMKGRQLGGATAAGAEPPPTTLALRSGCDGLAPILLHVAERERAAWKSTVDTAERSIGGVSLAAAQRKFDLSAAVGCDAVARAIQEIRHSEDLVKSALGQTSISGVAQALADIQRSEDAVKATLGTYDHIKSALGDASKNAALDAITGFRSAAVAARSPVMGPNLRDLAGMDGPNAALEAISSVGTAQEAARRAVLVPDLRDLAVMGGTSSALEAVASRRSVEEAARRTVMGPDIGDLGGMGDMDPARVGLTESFPQLGILHHRMPKLPPNPIHKTLRELLAHQKSEAEKKEADRVGAKIDSGDNKKIAKSSLVYTKGGFWVSIIATFVIPAAGFLWAYFGKAEALEGEKKSAMQIVELRAEIRALKASISAPQVPAKPAGALKPGGQANIKQK